jgi:hypothetical protein
MTRTSLVRIIVRWRGAPALLQHQKCFNRITLGYEKLLAAQCERVACHAGQGTGLVTKPRRTKIHALLIARVLQQVHDQSSPCPDMWRFPLHIGTNAAGMN